MWAIFFFDLAHATTFFQTQSGRTFQLDNNHIYEVEWTCPFVSPVVSKKMPPVEMSFEATEIKFIEPYDNGMVIVAQSQINHAIKGIYIKQAPNATPTQIGKDLPSNLEIKRVALSGHDLYLLTTNGTLLRQNLVLSNNPPLETLFTNQAWENFSQMILVGSHLVLYNHNDGTIFNVSVNELRPGIVPKLSPIGHSWNNAQLVTLDAAYFLIHSGNQVHKKIAAKTKNSQLIAKFKHDMQVDVLVEQPNVYLRKLNNGELVVTRITRKQEDNLPAQPLLSDVLASVSSHFYRNWDLYNIDSFNYSDPNNYFTTCRHIRFNAFKIF